MRGSKSCKFRGDGFTLVELLVVIGIVAVLVSLLFPLLDKARSYSARVRCARNMRQIYEACLMFANENKGRLPRPTWGPEPARKAPDDPICWVWAGPGVADLEQGVLWTFLPPAARRTVILCPADAGEPPMYQGVVVYSPRNHSYSFNANLRLVRPDGRLASLKIQSVLTPAEKIMIYEEIGPDGAACHFPFAHVSSYPSGRHGARGALNTRRELYDPLYLKEGLGNHAFFDGHVEALRPMQIIGHSEHYGPLTAGAY